MTFKTVLAAAFLAVASWASAATKGNGTIVVRATKASKVLVENWVNAYMQVRPEVNIVISDKAEGANISIVNDATEGLDVANVGRFALLPVTPVDNPLYKEVAQKQWSEKDIKKLFFQTEEDLFQDASEKSKREKLSDKLVVFSGTSSSSAAQAFAQHFGFSKGDIRGKRIAGDDLYLLNAIQKDKQSVTFNTLAYLFDLNSRQLKQDLAVLPLNIKKEQEAILQSGNLDETIKLLESESISTIPVANVGFQLNDFNSDVDDFLSWVVTDGQQYNNQAGFLKLSTRDAKQQLQLLAKR